MLLSNIIYIYMNKFPVGCWISRKKSDQIRDIWTNIQPDSGYKRRADIRCIIDRSPDPHNASSGRLEGKVEESGLVGVVFGQRVLHDPLHLRRIKALNILFVYYYISFSIPSFTLFPPPFLLFGFFPLLTVLSSSVDAKFWKLLKCLFSMKIIYSPTSPSRDFFVVNNF